MAVTIKDTSVFPLTTSSTRLVDMEVYSVDPSVLSNGVIRLLVNVVFSNDLWSTGYKKVGVGNGVLCRCFGLVVWSMSARDWDDELRSNADETQDDLTNELGLFVASFS